VPCPQQVFGITINPTLEQRPRLSNRVSWKMSTLFS